MSQFMMFVLMQAGNGGNGQRKLDNPPPGTILDHTVTRKDWYLLFCFLYKIDDILISRLINLVSYNCIVLFSI